jgi:Protein of unknown function (DUF3093)
MSTSGSVTAGAPFGGRQFGDLHELSRLHPLHHQLRDPVAAGEFDGRAKIVVDQTYPDFPAIARVDGARRVDHGQARTGGQSGPRMDEPGVPGRQRDRDAGSHDRPLPGVDDDVAGGHEIGPGIAGARIGRHGHTRIEPGEQDLHGGHGRRDYPEHVRERASGNPKVPAREDSPKARAEGARSQAPGSEPENTGTGEKQRAGGSTVATRVADTGNVNAVEANSMRHSERLYVPWWGWPLPLLGAGLLAAEIHMGYPGVRAWLPYVILLPLMAAWLLVLGRAKVRLSGDELLVGDARLPLRFVGEVEVIGRERKRKALGPELDPAAYVLHRGWVGPVLRVHLTDPEDPTPYWVFSTRKPEALAELLREPHTSRGGTREE